MRFKRNEDDPKKDREECGAGEDWQINVLTRHKLITPSHTGPTLDNLTVLTSNCPLTDGRQKAAAWEIMQCETIKTFSQKKNRFSLKVPRSRQLSFQICQWFCPNIEYRITKSNQKQRVLVWYWPLLDFWSDKSNNSQELQTLRFLKSCCENCWSF